ncbi:CoA-disulfide reductase [Nocardioides seonyuensis]|uniref:CoA-disulfide reductase n=1 Tax=Nocardioides seonyuensis TaxID=2518371 RepID=A0A4P7IC78_9ACTN|nr:FAD-dependent oxidoreductase [Nocardioides seonyuensis]QBX54704.1 CoA-disulfide reductase [Nocardioides seonyuensis]
MSSDATRVLVIGADAAGMSAAHQALRTAGSHGRSLQVTVVDKGAHTSYSACGIPYWMAGDVESGDELVARTVEQHREAGIEMRLGTEAVAVDVTSRTVTVRGGQDVDEETLEYDELVVATGAPAIVPAWALRPDGTPYVNVGPVKTLDDGAAWESRFEAAGEGAHVVVVGAGYVGVEVAEAALRRGLGVTVVTRGRGLALLEEEMSEKVAIAMCDAGAEVVLGVEVTGLETATGESGGHRATGVRWEGGGRDADLVVLAIGVRPATGFLRDSGLPMGDNGALLPDEHGRVAPGIWAAGDCCEVRRRIDDRTVFRPLGTHANKLGRVLGDNLAGGSLAFPGVVDTSITRFAACGEYLEIARTGLGLEEAQHAGYDAVALVTEGTTASGYMPEAEPISVWVLACRSTRRLLGVQVVGGHGAGKRVDTAAAVLWSEGTVDDLAWMDLAYAPPFSTAWDILQIAARRLAERL